MIDQPRSDSSSRVAAGLVTPITGSRFAISWRWPWFYPRCDAFYRWVEERTQSEVWHVDPAWRIFTGQDEGERCQERWLSEQGQQVLRESELQVRQLAASPVRDRLHPWGGMEMGPAARLDVPRLIDCTHAFLNSLGALVETELDCDGGIEVSGDSVIVPDWRLRGRWIALCQGIAASSNRWFADLPLHPARGDILEIMARQTAWERVIHHRGWAVPLGHRRYLVGATYDRHCLDTRLDHGAAQGFRQELIARWESMTGEPISPDAREIVRHRAAIRPASYDRHPLLGPHSQHPRILCFNGLGSKGSLMAPGLAEHLLDAMIENSPIDPGLRWDRQRVGR
jgi:glycine/D-amino acid oxidase-like deaminating enzyme